MLRALLVAAVAFALPAAAFAQNAPTAPQAPAAKPAPPATGGGHPVKPKPKPSYKPGSGNNGHGTNGHGSYETNVVVDPNDYISTPKPHTSNPPSHVQQYPGTETFSSQSTGSH